MTKELFDHYVELANGCPMVLLGDNMQLFYVNMDGNYFTQTNECVCCTRVNTARSAGLNKMSQSDAPYEVVIFRYDEIQYIKIYPDTKTLGNLLDDTVPAIEGQTLEDIKNEIFSNPVIAANSPTGYSQNPLNDKFSGAVVGMGKEPEKYVIHAMDKFNSEN